MVILKVGDTFMEEEMNIFKNFIAMDEIILPFEWHSFCISINPRENTMKLYHNDHIQARQNFSMTHGKDEGIGKLMTMGHLGGPKFVGFLSDFQIFGSALSDEDLSGWTTCSIKVYSIFVLHTSKML